MSKVVSFLETDGRVIVTGLDDAILAKARELVAIEEGTPRNLREGMIFYTYKGHFLCCDSNEGHGHWYVQTIEPTCKLHEKLKGKFTTTTLAKQLIDANADPKVIEAGEDVLERKRLNRKQRVQNGSRDPLPKEVEEASIKQKALTESFKR